ncbi:MAG: hypothetical protein ACR2LV_07780 [Solirubrobacteraceae bacterium]
MALPIPRSSSLLPARRRTLRAVKPPAIGLSPPPAAIPDEIPSPADTVRGENAAATLRMIGSLAHALVVQTEFIRRDAAEGRAPVPVLDAVDSLVAHAHDARRQSESLVGWLERKEAREAQAGDPRPARVTDPEPAPVNGHAVLDAPDTRDAAHTFAIEMMLGGASRLEIERCLARDFGRADAAELAAEACSQR